METRRGGAKRKEDDRLEQGPLAKRTRSNYQNAAFEPVALTQEPRAKKKGPSKPPLPVPPALDQPVPSRRRSRSQSGAAAGPGAEPASGAVPSQQEQAAAGGDMDRNKRDNSTDNRRNPDNGGDDERDDPFGRNFSNTHSALQGLLRKLGAGFEDIIPGAGMSGSRIKGIINNLKQAEDESSQLMALTDLCELLSISTEDTMTVFPVEQVVPLLVNLLNMEHNPDIMLYAARALTFMADVMPASCGSIVRHGAVAAFCARLLTIEYIDLAEQSLQALEKLSHEYSHYLLENGGLLAVLSYLDFFPTSVQRTAVATAANMCRMLSTEDTSTVEEAIPMLTNLLQYQDTKVVDNACTALSFIAEAFAGDAKRLELLNTHGLINQAIQLVNISEGAGMASRLSTTTYYTLIKLLATAASGSHTIAETLLQAGTSEVLRTLLANSSMLSTSTTPASILKSTDQLYEVVSLAHELLPPLADAARAVQQDLPLASGAARGSAGGAGTSASAAASEEQCLRAQFMSQNPEILQKFSQDLLPLLVQVYGSTVMQEVRRRCLATIIKLLYFCQPALLTALLADVNIASFLSSLLASRDWHVVAAALQMAEILMDKSSDSYAQLFLKEGVVHAMDQLAQQAPQQAPQPNARLTRAKSKDMEKEAAAAATAQAAAEAKPGRVQPPSLKDAICTRAARFKQQHFSETSRLAGLETAGLKQLKRLCADLGSSPAAAQELIDALTSSSISVFELLSSGAVQRLNDYLMGRDLAADAKDRDSELLQRLAAFVELVLAPGTASSPPLLALVRKLLTALGSVEAFPVVCSPAAAVGSTSSRSLGRSFSAGSYTGNTLSNGLAALMNPFKIRLEKHVQEKGLREYSSHYVLIEPLASLSAVEDFLWSKVSRGMSVPELEKLNAAEAGGAAGAAAAGASAAAGAAQPGSTSGQASGAGAAAAKPAATASAPVPTGRQARSGSRAQPIPESSAAQPIPEEPAGRRMTRAAAARAMAQARTHAHDAGDADADAGAPASGDGMSEEPDVMLYEDEGHRGDEGGPSGGAEDMSEDGKELDEGAEEGDGAGGSDPYGEHYDDDDEEIDDDMADGQDLDVGSMPVHDLLLGGPGSTSARGSEAPAGAAADAPAAPAAAASTAAAGAAAPAAAADAAARSNSATGAAAAGAASGAARTAWGQGSNGSQQTAAQMLQQQQPRLQFYLNDTPISSTTSVFQAIHMQQQQQQAAAAADDTDPAAAARNRHMWEGLYVLKYRLAASAASDAEAAAAAASKAADEEAKAALRPVPSGQWARSPLVELLTSTLPKELTAPESCKQVLQLLQLLEAVNRLGPRLASSMRQSGASAAAEGLAHGRVPREDLTSSKLGSKLSQQLKDVLSICGGTLPVWCKHLLHSCKFLFPFEVRRRYFYCTALGMGRALQHVQQQQSSEAGTAVAADSSNAPRVGRLSRQKVRISRKRIWESAAKVFEMYAKNKVVLEIEYYGEVGTGLGPTLEFYTLLSHDLQRKDMGLWRHDDREPAASEPDATATTDASGPDSMDVDSPPEASAASASASASAAPTPTASAACGSMRPEVVSHEGGAVEYVNAPNGLFPAPLAPGERAAGSKAVEGFRLLGRAVGKALQDSRLMDLPLNYVFYRAALGKAVDMRDISRFDPSLGASLDKLHRSLCDWRAAGSKGPLLVDGVPLSDLCLTFTLPGYPAYPLAPKGADTEVDESNLEQYIQAVVNATLGEGVAAQLASFREGFSEVFPLPCLEAFYEDELETLLCGAGEAWSVQSLADCIKFDHGYNTGSAPVRALLEVLAEMDSADQRRFLRFVTGCPRLPAGGLAALQPRLTVVRKHPTGDGSATPGGTPIGSLKETAGGGTVLADGDLPSVMTCANYIKLPPYSCKEVMRQRLLYAIREGQGSFDLS